MIARLALLLLVVPTLRAAEPVQLYELQTTDPKESRVVAATLSPDGQVSVEGTTFSVKDLISLRAPKVPLPALPGESHIVLANGDRIAGDVIGGDGLSLRLAANLGTVGKPVELTIPLSAISAIWFVPPPQDGPLDPTKYPWFDAAKKQDTLKFRNGDAVRGTLERFAPAGGPLRFKPAGEPTAKPFELNKLAAIAFDPSLARIKPPAGQHFRVVTRTGSRLTLSAASFDGKTFTGTTTTGAKFAMPQSDLDALDTIGGKVAYLADMKTKEWKHEPYGSVNWPLVANRSVREAPLRLNTSLGEETWDRGLGMHSKSTASYDLAGKYRTFRTTVGLDRVSGIKGVVDIRVFLDGKQQTIPGLKGLTAEASVEIKLDVTGAKLLTLVVDFGEGGDIGDDLNWAGAKLVE